MRDHFNEQLARLNTELVVMGALCEEAISKAVKCLVDSDDSIKNEVSETEVLIDQKERDIESLCMKLLLQQQPVATDLRTISSALKMISDMERIGDQAYDITEIVAYINESGICGRVHIEDMARATIKMVTDSVDSFVRKDPVLAHKVIKHDDIVDSHFYEVKKELINGMKNETQNPEALIDMLMVAKYFERIGDHAVNIAEWVIFSLTGKK